MTKQTFHIGKTGKDAENLDIPTDEALDMIEEEMNKDNLDTKQGIHNVAMSGEKSKELVKYSDEQIIDMFKNLIPLGEMIALVPERVNPLTEGGLEKAPNAIKREQAQRDRALMLVVNKGDAVPQNINDSVEIGDRVFVSEHAQPSHIYAGTDSFQLRMYNCRDLVTLIKKK